MGKGTPTDKTTNSHVIDSADRVGRKEPTTTGKQRPETRTTWGYVDDGWDNEGVGGVGVRYMGYGLYFLCEYRKGDQSM